MITNSNNDNSGKDFAGLELTDSEAEDDEDDDVTEAVTSVSEERQWVGVSDLAIGGRCKCNGHASECTLDRATGKKCFLSLYYNS